jgi:parvulin-like peptidyl-prolyl isomerase
LLLLFFLCKAEAFHILLPITSREKEAPAALLKLEAVKKQCLEAKTPEKSLEVFSAAASKMSSCPSSQKGGFLGRFKRGAMVPTFDDAVFAQDTAPGTPVGPVLTMFGAHLIWVKSISNA